MTVVKGLQNGMAAVQVEEHCRDQLLPGTNPLQGQEKTNMEGMLPQEELHPHHHQVGLREEMVEGMHVHLLLEGVGIPTPHREEIPIPTLGQDLLPDRLRRPIT